MAEGSKKKINPFKDGVSLAEFSKALGKTPIESYLKGICTIEEIKAVKRQLEFYKNKEK